MQKYRILDLKSTKPAKQYPKTYSEDQTKQILHSLINVEKITAERIEVLFWAENLGDPGHTTLNRRPNRPTARGR